MKLEKNKSINTSSLVIILLLLFITQNQGVSQDLSGRIQLINHHTKKPIPDVHYLYGNDKGVSDEKGIIHLRYDPGCILIISHVELGKLEIDPSQVKNAISQGTLQIKGKGPVMLQPVTIMSMRSGQVDQNKLSLSDYDRLSHDAGSYLSRTPAVSVIRKSGNYGFDPVLRGFKYEQLNLIVDGAQTALAACPSRMDPPASQISLNQMERVEILKGPHLLRYGTVIGGTLNFISAQPEYSETLDPLGRLSTSYESNGNIFRTEGVAGIRNRNYLINFNGSWSMGNDYTDGSGIRVPSEFNRGSFGSNMRFKVSQNQDLSLNITRNLARDVVFAALPMDLREDNTWLVNGRHELKITDRNLTSWTTTVYLTHVRHLMDNLDKNLDPRMVNATTDATTVSYGGRTEASFSYASSSAYFGADMRVEEAEGTRLREMLMGPMAGNTLEDNVWQDGRITKTGIFAEYRIKRSPVNYVLSGRLDINNAQIGEVANEFSDVYRNTGSTQVNPSFSLGLTGDITTDIDLGLWLGRAIRSGSLTERYINYFPVGLDPYEMLGNPELDPEINNQVDLNLSFQKRGSHIQLNMFASVLQNYISSVIREDLNPRLPASPGVRQFINIDKAMMTGFEFNWRQYLPAHLMLNTGIAFTYGEDLEQEEPLPEIPPLELRTGLTGHFIQNSLRPELEFRYVMRQKRISETFGETETPGFNVIDVRVTYDINKILHIAGGVENVFDVSYYEHLNRSVRNASKRPIYNPGRNFFLTLSVDLMD